MAATIITALLILWLVFAAIGFGGAVVFAHQVRKFGRLRFALPSPPPAAAVIVPMKGVGVQAELCLGRILTQDYPAYRVIVAVEAEHDPAARLARDAAARANKPVAVVAAGPARRRGQKVHNLAAGLATLSPGDQIVCFADADALWSPDTLATLVRELAAWDTPVLLSGYRWMFPAVPRAGAVLAAAASLPVAAIAKSPLWDLAWGGTMAARRATLERVDLPALWARSLSDDVPLSRALRAGGLDVKLMPNLVVPSPAAFSLGEAVNFARRQYAMARLYAPRHWRFSCAVYAVFFAGFAAALAAFLVPAPAAVQGLAAACWALAGARGLAHAAIVWRILPRHAAARLGIAAALDTLLPVLPALLHAYGLLASVFVRKLRWAGIAYTLTGSEVERVER